MKRKRDEDQADDDDDDEEMMMMKNNNINKKAAAAAMNKCLILLPCGEQEKENDPPTSRVFECKTCNRQFPSFQALGGHRASHKKPRLMLGDDQYHDSKNQSLQLKPKAHECSICGLEFPIGQALGGHMRRHRGMVNDAPSNNKFTSMQLPTVMKKANGRRVLCLDLNLAPSENDLNLSISRTRLADTSNPPILKHFF
ncbi:Zinc finger protein zat12 [Thalictrum thalictroides]|uniref:Zinc finger protein zat12 n=1 Tax=Thalictrum thalictroides TaxID=46969 RepID=A0A7J6W621_THATH|nr:Zinc finger protein zat12 [Thalictrum thalictroides]